MKLIPLTQGKFAIVPDDAYADLAQWKWNARKSRNTFYAQRNVQKPDGSWSTVQMHRVILGVTDHNIQVDHRDGNGLNCQRSNLRVATHTQNQRNAAKRKDNTSGVRGVCWYKRDGKWYAQIQVNGKKLCLGYFADIEDAKAARIAAEIQHHGIFSASLSREQVTA